MSTAMSSLVFLGCLIGSVESNAFLGPSSQEADTGSVGMLSARAEHTLLSELEAALGSERRHAAESRLSGIKKVLQPMFGAMTKNEHGRLGPASAGYMLHRVFVQRHGWYIRGLEPAGKSLSSWSTSSPTDILGYWLPEHIENLFETRLHQHGMGVHELAVLAATIEDLIHRESLSRLKVAYKGNGFSEEEEITKDDVILVVEMYMSLFISQVADQASLEPSQLQAAHRRISQSYPPWPETQKFIRNTVNAVVPKRDYLFFNDVATIVEEIGERYTTFQNEECLLFKSWLMEVEDPSPSGAGRVRIADFYRKSLNGSYQFSEKIEYLRQLGALDTSDPTSPRVIIPNYLSSSSNCAGSSEYFSTCCLDECEGILGRVEETLAKPEATPQEITALIAATPSSTMPGNRTLSPLLLRRLDEIAASHGGKVMLHSRLFKQWLHYAYPRECSFPHVTGSNQPESPEDKLGRDSHIGVIIADADYMKNIINGTQPRKDANVHEDPTLWTMDDELIGWHLPHDKSRQSAFSFDLTSFRGVAFFALSLSSTFAMVKPLLHSEARKEFGWSSKEHLV